MAGLFGSSRRPSNILQTIGDIGRAYQGGGTIAEQRMTREQAMQQQMLADRLRSQLSPADGPNGSGTGAAPDLQSQMAALEDARLLNPAVAQQFAPIVAERERRAQAKGLFGNDPKAQMLFTQGNEAFLNSLGEQYKPQVIGAGGRQSVYGEGRTVDAPSFTTVNDTIFRNDPGGGLSTPTATAAPAYADVTGRMNVNTTQELGRGRLALDRSQAGFTLGQGQQRFDVNGNPIAANAPAPSPQIAEARAAYDTNVGEVIPTLTTMRQALSSGDVITGIGADMRLQAARALAAAGNEDAKRQVAATENYRNMSGRLRVGMAKTLGANPSNADIALLEKVTAGDIGQNAESLLMTIDQGLQFANGRTASLQSQFGGQQQPQQAPAPQSGGSTSGPIAVNPQTGERIQWNGSQWVRVQ